MLENIKKCDFTQQYLVYLGYVICGGELKIDPAKMEAIMKWLVPTNVYEFRSSIGETQYLRKSIASFSVVAPPLHIITTSGKIFQWENGKYWASQELQKKISQALVMELLV